MAKTIKQHFDVDNIFLFGSYAYGEPDRHSDIDLLVVLNDECDPKPGASDIKKFLNNRFGILFPMDILVRSKLEYEDRLKKNDMFLQKITEQGIKL